MLGKGANASRRVEVAWKKDADWFGLETKLPPGISGEVRLPLSSADYKLEEYSGGELFEKAEGWQLDLAKGASLKVYARKVREVNEPRDLKKMAGFLV